MSRDKFRQAFFLATIGGLRNKGFFLFDHSDISIEMHDSKDRGRGTLFAPLAMGAGFEFSRARIHRAWFSLCHGAQQAPLLMIFVVAVGLQLCSLGLSAQTLKTGQLRVRILNPELRTILGPSESLKPVDQDICEGSATETSTLIREGFLESVVVWVNPMDEKIRKALEEQLKTAQKKEERLVISDCQFDRDIIWLYPGQKLRVLSKDPINYDLRFLSPPKIEIFMSLPPTLESSVREFSQVGVYFVDGVLHPPLKSILVVRGHPHYGITNENGSISLSKLPVGKYQINFWHAHLGAWTPNQILVVEERTQDLEFVWPEQKLETE